MPHSKTDLIHLGQELRDFIRTERGAAMARDDNREAWPVRLSTEPFVLDGVTFDAVEMDDSFRFYVSFSGGGVESERKLSNSTESDCSLMCVAARKAIATALAANSPH